MKKIKKWRNGIFISRQSIEIMVAVLFFLSGAMIYGWIEFTSPHLPKAKCIPRGTDGSIIEAVYPKEINNGSWCDEGQLQYQNTKKFEIENRNTRIMRTLTALSISSVPLVYIFLKKLKGLKKNFRN